MWCYIESEYLEEDRLRCNYLVGIDFFYDIGSYISLMGSIIYVNIEEWGISIMVGVSENINSMFGLSCMFGEYFIILLNLSYFIIFGNLS